VHTVGLGFERVAMVRPVVSELGSVS
jgi:hypothetical protein